MFINTYKRDVTKQNGHARVGTLYRELLGDMVVVHYDSTYKIGHALLYFQ